MSGAKRPDLTAIFHAAFLPRACPTVVEKLKQTSLPGDKWPGKLLCSENDRNQNCPLDQ